MKRVSDIAQIFEEVQMVGIDVKDDTDQRIEMQEAVGVFTGLGHEMLPGTDAEVSSYGRQDTAYRQGRIGAGPEKYLRYHGSRSRFAMGTADCDRTLIGLHDQSQKFSSGQNSDPARVSIIEVCIARADSCGIYDQIRIIGNVTDGLVIADDSAQTLKPLGERRTSGVGTRDVEMPGEQELCKPAHADTAYAYEVYVFWLI